MTDNVVEGSWTQELQNASAVLNCEEYMRTLPPSRAVKKEKKKRRAGLGNWENPGGPRQL